ncbi:GMC oxidoreductase [Pseudonocardia sulfidoxydans]|uniref:GMC oxidoreductase n=1 Tax=Pseudonocardia sulfidoxydans TaxID=54011 RepID=UPI001FED146A|nr:GMC family oxidoreductase [Pseudonocardia sulfidoxydans]
MSHTAADRMTLAGVLRRHLVGYPIRPTTQSSIHLGGPSPEDPPVIRPRYVETGEDQAATARILGWGREMVTRNPLAELVESGDQPGLSISTAEQVVRPAQDSPLGVHHAIGSAAMGPDPDDVVDDRLRVRGVEGLRIVDAPVFADQPAGNTTAPTMAPAWRAADLIRQES